MLAFVQAQYAFLEHCGELIVIKIGDKELIFTTSFPIKNNQTVALDIPGIDPLTIGLEVKDKPQNIPGMPADEWINHRSMNNDYTFSVGFLDSSKLHSKEETFVVLGRRQLSLQILRQGMGEFMLVHLFLFSKNL